MQSVETETETEAEILKKLSEELKKLKGKGVRSVTGKEVEELLQELQPIVKDHSEIEQKMVRFQQEIVRFEQEMVIFEQEMVIFKQKMVELKEEKDELTRQYNVLDSEKTKLRENAQESLFNFFGKTLEYPDIFFLLKRLMAVIDEELKTNEGIYGADQLIPRLEKSLETLQTDELILLGDAVYRMSELDRSELSLLGEWFFTCLNIFTSLYYTVEKRLEKLDEVSYKVMAGVGSLSIEPYLQENPFRNFETLEKCRKKILEMAELFVVLPGQLMSRIESGQKILPQKQEIRRKLYDELQSYIALSNDEATEEKCGKLVGIADSFVDLDYYECLDLSKLKVKLEDLESKKLDDFSMKDLKAVRDLMEQSESNKLMSRLANKVEELFDSPEKKQLLIDSIGKINLLLGFLISRGVPSKAVIVLATICAIGEEREKKNAILQQIKEQKKLSEENERVLGQLVGTTYPILAEDTVNELFGDTQGRVELAKLYIEALKKLEPRKEDRSIIANIEKFLSDKMEDIYLSVGIAAVLEVVDVLATCPSDNKLAKTFLQKESFKHFIRSDANIEVFLRHQIKGRVSDEYCRLWCEVYQDFVADEVIKQEIFLGQLKNPDFSLLQWMVESKMLVDKALTPGQKPIETDRPKNPRHARSFEPMTSLFPSATRSGLNTQEEVQVPRPIPTTS